MTKSGNRLRSWYKRARYGATLGSIVLIGCSSDPAEPNEPSVYESTDDFSVPGSGSVPSPGLGNGGEDYPSNNPLYSASPSRNAALVGQRLVVFPGPDVSAPLPYRPSRGVLVYSVEDRTTPTLVSELSVSGYALQMAAGADHVTIVARVPRQLELTEIPTTALQNDATMLMHLDLTDPNDPQLLASTELAGDFWQVVERDGYTFVLSQVRRPSEEPCAGYETSSAATTETMRVSSYRLDGTSSYELVDEQDLPGDGYAAFGTSSAFVSVMNTHAEDPTLSVASFSPTGGITVSAPLAVAGPVTAVDITGTSLAVATLAEDVAELALYDVSDPSALTQQSSQPIPRAAFNLSQTELLSEPVVVGNGWVLRTASAAEPLLVPGVDTYRVFVADDALLSAARDADGKVSLSSWTVAPPFTLTRTSHFSTEWPAVEVDDSGYSGPFSWEKTTQTLYYSYAIYDSQSSDSTSRVGVAGLSGSTLQLLGDVKLAGDFGAPLVDEQGAELVGSYGVQGIALGAELTASTYLPFYGAGVDHIVDRRSTDIGQFTLVRRGDSILLQYPAPASGDRREETLPHFATELVVAEGAIAAAGLYWNQDCGRDLDVPELELGCPTPRQRGVTFVSLAESAGDPRTLLIDDSLGAPALPADTEQTTTWLGYLRQGARLLFPVTRLIRCNTREACDALGFPWYVSYGTPGCNPEVEDCASKPLEPIQFVQGYGRESMLYVVDPVSAEAFAEPVVVGSNVDFQDTLQTPHREDGGPLDLAALVLRDGNVLGFPTDTPVYNSEGNSVPNAYGESLHRFGVELVSVAEDGSLTPQASVNTPGRVVALVDEGSVLYSLAPSHLDADHISALLYRLNVVSGRATIERSLDLGVGFRDARASGEQIHFVFGPEASCFGWSPERESTFFSVDTAPFARGPSLSLPWDSWSFDRSVDGIAAASVLLSGGPAGYRGRAEIDVSGAEPQIAAYFTVAP